MLKDGTHLTDQPKMQGSLMIYEAESIDVVWKLIKEDIYYTGNVVRGALIPIAIQSCPYAQFSVGQGEIADYAIQIRRAVTEWMLIAVSTFPCKRLLLPANLGQLIYCLRALRTSFHASGEAVTHN